MRPIKFRAWDSFNEEMWEPEFLHDLWAGNRCHTARLLPPYKNSIIMQYTGLCDKNGKEIYEGDIVKLKTTGEKKPFYEKFEVIWQHNRMRFGLKDNQEGHLEDSWAFTPKNDFEVIGNIYENPKLLEKLT